MPRDIVFHTRRTAINIQKKLLPISFLLHNMLQVPNIEYGKKKKKRWYKKKKHISKKDGTKFTY